MSDQSQGPGWWLASDGKWYSPDQAPAVPPPETWAPPPVPPPGRSGGTNVGLIVGVSLLGVLLLIVFSIIALQFLGVESERSFSSTGDAIDDGAAEEEDEEPPRAAIVPEGFALVEGDGVSIAVPESWEEIDPEMASMTAEEFAEAFPDAPEGIIEQEVDAFDQGSVLVAFDLVDADFSSNVNIIEVPQELPLAILEGQATDQLESLGADVTSVERVRVPAGDAVRVEYVLEVAGPGGEVTPAHGVQYYVVGDGTTHIITVSAGDRGAGALADEMVETFRAG